MRDILAQDEWSMIIKNARFSCVYDFLAYVAAAAHASYRPSQAV